MPGPRKQPKAATPGEDYMHMSDVAEVLNCSMTSAYRMAHEGTIPTLRIGRMLRVPRSKLMRCIAENSHDGSSAA